MVYKVALHRSEEGFSVCNHARASRRQPSRCRKSLFQKGWGKHIVMTDGSRIVKIPRHNPINKITTGTIIWGAGLTVPEFRKLL
jgi:hypothetical protein